MHCLSLHAITGSLSHYYHNRRILAKMKEKKYISRVIFALSILALCSCSDGYIGHIHETRLVILQPIPDSNHMIEKHFRSFLTLLYPHECHDTTFIQDEVALERIGTPVPYRNGILRNSDPLRDFLGITDAATMRSQVSRWLFSGMHAIEKNPPGALSMDHSFPATQIRDTLLQYINYRCAGAFVYLISMDTACKTFIIGAETIKVCHDPAILNCRIVSDLRNTGDEEAKESLVVIILIPSGDNGTTMENEPFTPNESSWIQQAEMNKTPCPPANNIGRMNHERDSLITEFRNLLHYIATTKLDVKLRNNFCEEAYREIHRIPGLRVEGIPGNDLHRFLFSGFPVTTTITPIINSCRLITGIRIHPG